MAPHKTLNFIPKRFSRSTCDFDSGGSIEKIRQAQCEWFFDILTFSYIFQRLEKRGRGRGTYLRLIILKKKIEENQTRQHQPRKIDN